MTPPPQSFLAYFWLQHFLWGTLYSFTLMFVVFSSYANYDFYYIHLTSMCVNVLLRSTVIHKTSMIKLWHVCWLAATQTIYISISDINDHPPIFPQAQYHVSLPEEQPLGASVIALLAQDADIGENARLTYTVQPAQDGAYFYADSLYVSRTGIIRVNQVCRYLFGQICHK